MAYPDEIMAGFWTPYIAPLGTAFPATPAVAPAAAWIRIGTQSDAGIPESGITMAKTLEQDDYYGLGTTARIKTFTTRESHDIEFDLADLSLEALSLLKGGPATAAGDVVDTPAATGVAGYRTLTIQRGFTNRQFALLLRKADSPYGEFSFDLRLPRVQAAGAYAFAWVKGVPALAHFHYKSIFDPTLGLGSWVAQDAVAI